MQHFTQNMIYDMKQYNIYPMIWKEHVEGNVLFNCPLPKTSNTNGLPHMEGIPENSFFENSPTPVNPDLRKTVGFQETLGFCLSAPVITFFW